MAMNWLKGLVAAPAQFPNQGYPPGMAPPMQQGMQQPGMPGGMQGPPIGGAPYGYPPPGAPMGPPPVMPGAPDPMQQMQQQWQAPQWSQGTKTQGEVGNLSGGPPAAPIAGGAAPVAAMGAGPSTSANAPLEARIAQLQHDVESLALFARTLLTMLEERNVVTPEQFQETKKRLDMLDGKLDDR